MKKLIFAALTVASIAYGIQALGTWVNGSHEGPEYVSRATAAAMYADAAK